MLARCLTATCTAAIGGGVIATILESRNISNAVIIVGAVAALIAAMWLCANYVANTVRAENAATRRELCAARDQVSDDIRATNRPADKAFELGYEMGHNKGWTEAKCEATGPRRIGLAAVDGEAVSR